MNERERLIEVLDTYHVDYGAAVSFLTDQECEDIADLLLANGVTVQRWIPVTERLPEIVTTQKAWKNIYRKSRRVLCACLQTDGKRMVKEGYMEFFNDYPEPNWKIPGTIHSVTHWMPLPAEPKEEE